MPSTRARSDGLRKGPALSRKATIRAARRRPMPDIRSRSVADPRLMTSVMHRCQRLRPVARAPPPTDARSRRLGARKQDSVPCAPASRVRSPARGAARRYRRRARPGCAPRRCDARGRTRPPAGAGAPAPRLDPRRFAHPGPGGGQGAPDCRVVRARQTKSTRPAAAPHPAAGGHRTRPCARRDRRVRGQGGAVPRDVRGTCCECRAPAAGRRHPNSRCGYFFPPDSSRITAIITSPTAWRLCALSLSGVSSRVCQRLLLLP